MHFFKFCLYMNILPELTYMILRYVGLRHECNSWSTEAYDWFLVSLSKLNVCDWFHILREQIHFQSQKGIC